MILPRSGVFLLLILLAVAGCKRDIRSGDLGPLTIGQSKLEALAALKAYGLFKEYGLWTLEPVLYNSQYVVNPTRDRLAKLFSEDAGIYVLLGGAGVPLRIEFTDNLVARKWPEIDTFVTIHEWVNRQNREYARLDQRIKLGMSREGVFDAIGKIKSSFRVSVSNFVVGYQRFRWMRQREREANAPDYRNLIFANDGWQFYGLKEEVWYESILSPDQSGVTIYFRNDRIEHIEHEYFLFEGL